MISRKFLFADHQNTIQKIRDSNRDIAENTSHMYIYIYIYNFILAEIHDQYIGLSKTFFSNHLQAQFPIIDDRPKLFSRSFTCPSSSEKCPLSFSISISYKWYLFVESNYPNYFSWYITITYTIGCQNVSRILVLSIIRNQWFSNRVRYHSGFCRRIDERNLYHNIRESIARAFHLCFISKTLNLTRNGWKR